MGQVKGEQKQEFKRINVSLIIFSFLFAVTLWISITLSSQFNIYLNFPLQIVNIPEGNSLATKLPDQVHLLVKSTGWKLLALLLNPDQKFTVSLPSELNGNSSFAMKNAVAENIWLGGDVEIMSIVPAEIQLGIDRTISRMRQIVPDIAITYQTNYGLARPISVTPESVMISGSRKLINDIREIRTEKKEFENIQKSFQVRVRIHPILGVDIQTEYVDLFFDVQRIVESNISSIPVSISNVPPDNEVLLLPGEISVGIKGGIEIIGRIQPADIHAFVRYEDIVNDSLEYIEPLIELPEFCEKMYVDPGKLRYIIKKK